MSETGTTARPAESDEAILHRLGYAQVLYREMGGFSNFAISFTIISILAGCLTSYVLAWNYGGPVAISWGWLLVGAFCVLVSMALGEIASSMPTAGALYYWASKLGSPAWGWFTGWFNLIGQIAVTAAIDYGAATFTTLLLNLLFPDAIGTDTGAIFITYTVILALHLALNLAEVNLLALLNSVSAWWHMAGVAVIVLVLIFVPEQHQSAGFVFGQWINNSGFGDGLFVFGLGLLMAQYTITGYDASAHMSEETRQASRSAALGMVMSVVASVVFGFILLLAVTFAVSDVDGTTAAGTSMVVFIWTGAVGQTLTAFMLVIACVAQFFCGTASVTSASRMMFAFSRDRAVPGSRIWRKVSRNRVPVNAVIAIAVLAWVLMIPTLANGIVGYAVGTSIAVIGLYIAFALPVILRIKAGDRFEHGAWSLGNHYKWIAPISVAWIAIICILFLLPISPKGIPGAEDFTWESVNYAPITVIGALILFGGWYLLSARTWFTGPVREADTEAGLESIEHQLEVEAEAGHGGLSAATVATAGATATAVAVADAPADTDTAVDTEVEAEAKDEVEVDPKTNTEPEKAEEPEAKAEPEVDAEPEIAPDGAAEAKADAETDTAAETEASADDAAETEDAEDGTATEATEAESTPETAAKAEPDAAPESTTEAEAKPEAE